MSCWDLLEKEKRFRPLVYESDLSEEAGQGRVDYVGGKKVNPGPDISEEDRSAGCAVERAAGRVG